MALQEPFPQPTNDGHIPDGDNDSESEDEYKDVLRRCPSQDDLSLDGFPASSAGVPWLTPWLESSLQMTPVAATTSSSDDESPENKDSQSWEHPLETLPGYQIHKLRSALAWHGPSTYKSYCLQADMAPEADARAMIVGCCQPEDPAEVVFKPKRGSRPSTSRKEASADLPGQEVVMLPEASRTAAPEVKPTPMKQWPYRLSSTVGLIDTHCHLDFLFRKNGHRGSYADFRAKHRTTFPDCYEGCVANFCDPPTFKQRPMWSRILSEEGVWGAFGCHPHMARLYTEVVEEELIDALEHPKVVALGEIGLDYSHKNKCDHELQKKVFRQQLRLALNGRVPLIIHSRDATRDTIEILKEMVPVDYRIHRHCFTGGWSEAQQWLREFPNLCLGLTPLIGFSNAGPVVEVARRIPLNRLLIETDSPYFLPKWESGRLKASHPGMAIHVATRIASMRRISVDDVLTAVRKNTQRIYGI